MKTKSIIKKNFKRIVVLAFLIINASPTYVWGQTYLSKNSFRTRTATDDGTNIWIGSFGNGILRIDKATGDFQIYHSSNSELLSNHVWTLAVDSQKNIWCGTWNGGLSKFNRDNWTTYTTRNSNLPDNDVRSVKIDKKGHVWAGTWNNGLYEYNGEYWKKHLAKFSYAMTIDSSGNVWAAVNPACNSQTCSGGGLYKYDGRKWENYELAHLFNQGNGINDLVVDNDGNAWVATGGIGLLKFDGEWNIYNTTNSQLFSNNIPSLTINKDGEIFLISNSSSESHVIKIDNDNWEVVSSKLPFNGATFIFSDANENIWTANYRGGLARLKRGKWILYETGNSEISSNTINALAYDRGHESPIGEDGNLWIGAENVLDVLSDGIWASFRGINPLSSQSNISCIDYKFINNSDIPVWVGLSRNPIMSMPQAGLFKIRGNECSTIFTHYVSVNTIKMDESNRLWVGTDGGLIMYKNNIKYTFSDSVLSEPSFNAIAVDKELNVWLGTKQYWLDDNYSCKLIKYNENDISVYDTSNSILADHSINGIVIDGQGQKWLGTNNGLIMFDDISWKTFDTENSELPSNNIQTLVLGPDKNLWIGTDHGLVRYNGNDSMSIYTVENSELLSNSIKAIAFGDNNKIFIGTHMGGLTVFNGNAPATFNQYKQVNFGACKYLLYQNYPNPFAPSTIIKYDLFSSNNVLLKIYNQFGQEVETLVNEFQSAGQYEVIWQITDLPSGIYYYRIQVGECSETKKIIRQ